MYLLFVDVCRGPEGTPFEGGVFVTELIFPTDYPLSPPKMKFTSEMFHPNGKSKPSVEHTATYVDSSLGPFLAFQCYWNVEKLGVGLGTRLFFKCYSSK